jgi:hypothetical protein
LIALSTIDGIVWVAPLMIVTESEFTFVALKLTVRTAERSPACAFVTDVPSASASSTTAAWAGRNRRANTREGTWRE